jgi:predicted metalloenzyme YecM
LGDGLLFFGGARMSMPIYLTCSNQRQLAILEHLHLSKNSLRVESSLPTASHAPQTTGLKFCLTSPSFTFAAASNIIYTVHPYSIHVDMTVDIPVDSLRWLVHTR